MNACLADRHASRTRGIVLPTVLVMLLILSVASMVIMEQIGTQTRMAGNAAAAQQSLQVAEVLLRNAAARLQTNPYPKSLYVSPLGVSPYGLYKILSTATTPPPWKSTADWAGAPLQPKINATTDTTTSRQFMIELLPAGSGKPGVGVGSNIPAPVPFRITARVVGPGGQGIVMLQTIYILPKP